MTNQYSLENSLAEKIHPVSGLQQLPETEMGRVQRILIESDQRDIYNPLEGVILYGI